MADVNIKKALIEAAKFFLTAQGIDPTNAVQWENVSFDPVGKHLWASVFYVPNTPEAVTLGAGGQDRTTGFLQIDFNIPQGGGDGPFNDIENAIRAEFIAGKVYTKNGVKVTITQAGLGQGRNVDNWFRKSATIVFRADLPRNTI